MASTKGAAEAVEKRSSCYLVFVRILEVVAALALLLMFVANILLLIQYGQLTASVDVVFQCILRVYNMIFCLLIIAALFDSKLFVKFMYFLDTWMGVGAFMIFNGVLTLSSCGGTDFDIANYTNAIRVCAGWIVLALGVVFFVLGIFAGKNKKFALQATEMT